MESQIASGQANPTPQKAGQIHCLDTLRVLAVLMVFVFHASKAFTAGEWHVMNDQTSMIASILFVAFLAPWGMPFFFLLAGAGTWFALQRRTARQFAGERFRRLLVPFLVGSAVFTPLQAFFEWRYFIRAEGYLGSYLQFNLDRWGGWIPTLSNWIGYHLWFLIFLFIFSLLALPLLTWLREPDRYLSSRMASFAERWGGNFALTGIHLWYLFWLFIFSFLLYPLLRWLKGRGQNIGAQLGDFLSRSGAVYILMLPTLLLFMFADPNSPLITEGEAGWPLIAYLWFVLCGFLLISNERLLASIRHLRRPALILASASFGVNAILLARLGEPTFGTGRFALMGGLRTLLSWSLVLALLGFSNNHLNVRTIFLTYANEAVLPFYILHQTILLTVGYFVVQWSVPDLLKRVVILLVSFGIIMVFYEYLVRRFNVMRILFGMKSIRHRPARQASEPMIEEVAGIR